MLNYISKADLLRHYSEDEAHVKYRRLISNISYRHPNDHDIAQLKYTLQCYQKLAATPRDKDLIDAVLIHPEIFDKARIVNDGSWLALRFYGRLDKDGKIVFRLDDNFEERKVRAYNYSMYVGDIGRRPAEERVKWVIDHYGIIPFQCQPLKVLMNSEYGVINASHKGRR